MIFLNITSIPLVVIAKIVSFLNIISFENDIKKSLGIIAKFSNIKIDKNLIEVLILAEDRRNKLHCGVDTIAVLRAIKVRIIEKTYQGASTIEQQFIRAATNRFEKTFYRKFREQVLAVMLNKIATKEDIAKSYLFIAYYGYNLTGLKAIEKICNNLDKVENIGAIKIVSRLKYPQPKYPNEIWILKNKRRVSYIEKLIKNNNNL